MTDSKLEAAKAAAQHAIDEAYAARDPDAMNRANVRLALLAGLITERVARELAAPADTARVVSS